MSKTSKDCILPPGTYWIGDPCYVIGQNSHNLNVTPSDDDWMVFLTKSYFPLTEQKDCAGGPVEYKGHKGFAASTYYGDGGFADNHGNEYGVDAGMIGCIPIEACEVDVDALVKRHLGAKFTFDEEVYCSRNEDGRFRFNNVVIDTDYEESPNEEFYG